MTTIQICIGSACHLKGSYIVIDSLQSLIKRDKLEKDIEIKASFCLGHCTNAVSIKVNDSDIMSVSPDTVEEFYTNTIKEMM